MSPIYSVAAMAAAQMAAPRASSGLRDSSSAFASENLPDAATTLLSELSSEASQLESELQAGVPVPPGSLCPPPSDGPRPRVGP